MRQGRLENCQILKLILEGLKEMLQNKMSVFTFITSIKLVRFETINGQQRIIQ